MTTQNKAVLKNKMAEYKERYNALCTQEELRQFPFKVATELQAWWATSQFGGGKLTRGDVSAAIRELCWESPLGQEAMSFADFILGNKDKIESLAKSLKTNDGLKGSKLSNELYDRIIGLSQEAKILQESVPTPEEWENLRKRLGLRLPMGRTHGSKNEKVSRGNSILTHLHPDVTSEEVPVRFKERALKELPALLERLKPVAERYLEELQMEFPLATYEVAQALLSGNEASQRLVIGDIIAKVMYSAALYRLERGEL